MNVAPIPHLSAKREAAFRKNYSVNDGGCWLWHGARNRSGYGIFSIERRCRLASRVAYALAYGDPGQHLVCHVCDTPACVNPRHLFLGNHEDNAADCYRKGRGRWRGRPAPELGRPVRRRSGARNPNSKLTEDDVRHIRTATHLTRRQLARQYGVAATTIGSIRTGQNWGHL